MVVAEVFGPTLQGEGPSTGQITAFVRLGRCNLSCGSGPDATWSCDTPFTWDWRGVLGTAYDAASELRRVDVDEVAAHVAAMSVTRCVVTGGEPLLQQRALAALASALADHGIKVEVETNGTQAPTAAVSAIVDQFNVSPKLANSGMAESRRRRPEALAALQSTGKAAWKFVVGDDSDLDEVAALVDAHALSPVWVMPAGTTAEATLETSRRIVDEVVRRRWNLTSRLHVLLWNDERGR